MVVLRLCLNEPTGGSEHALANENRHPLGGVQVTGDAQKGSELHYHITEHWNRADTTHTSSRSLDAHHTESSQNNSPSESTTAGHAKLDSTYGSVSATSTLQPSLNNYDQDGDHVEEPHFHDHIPEDASSEHDEALEEILRQEKDMEAAIAAAVALQDEQPSVDNSVVAEQERPAQDLPHGDGSHGCVKAEPIENVLDGGLSAKSPAGKASSAPHARPKRVVSPEERKAAAQTAWVEKVNGGPATNPLSLTFENEATKSWRSGAPPDDSLVIPDELVSQGNYHQVLARNNKTFIFRQKGSRDAFGIWGTDAAVKKTKEAINLWIQEQSFADRPDTDRAYELRPPTSVHATTKSQAQANHKISGYTPEQLAEAASFMAGATKGGEKPGKTKSSKPGPRSKSARPRTPKPLVMLHSTKLPCAIGAYNHRKSSVSENADELNAGPRLLSDALPPHMRKALAAKANKQKSEEVAIENSDIFKHGTVNNESSETLATGARSALPSEWTTDANRGDSSDPSKHSASAFDPAALPFLGHESSTESTKHTASAFNAAALPFLGGKAAPTTTLSRRMSYDTLLSMNPEQCARKIPGIAARGRPTDPKDRHSSIEPGPPLTAPVSRSMSIDALKAMNSTSYQEDLVVDRGSFRWTEGVVSRNAPTMGGLRGGKHPTGIGSTRAVSVTHETRTGQITTVAANAIQSVRPMAAASSIEHTDSPMANELAEPDDILAGPASPPTRPRSANESHDQPNAGSVRARPGMDTTAGDDMGFGAQVVGSTSRDDASAIETRDGLPSEYCHCRHGEYG